MTDNRKASAGLPTHSKPTSASEVGRARRGWAKGRKSQGCSNWYAALWHLICSYSRDGKKSARRSHAATPEFVLATRTLLKHTPFVSWDVRKITEGTTSAFSVVCHLFWPTSWCEHQWQSSAPFSSAQMATASGPTMTSQPLSSHAFTLIQGRANVPHSC